LPSHFSPPVPQSDRSFAWLPLAISVLVLLFCTLAVWVLGRPAWQALTQPPVFARTSLLDLPTATSIPTIVRLPTPFAPAATPVSVMARVIEARVNVRAGPSLQAQVVTTIPRDERITLIGRSADGQWYQVVYQVGTKPAWVFSETLEVVGANTQSLPIATP
jgi:uncharacterized protein YgiM (DUF1202 family)